MEKYYRFAGVELAVEPPEGCDYPDDKTLSPFRVDTVTDPHRFHYRIVESLTAPQGTPLAVLPELTVYGDPGAQVRYLNTTAGDWRKANMRAEHRGREHWVQLKEAFFPRGMTAKTLLNSCATEHLVAQAGGFVLHSSYIQWQDQAILFTAPSGTGKTTQAQLWQTHRNAEIINGDRAVVRMVDGQAMAEGIPYSGSSQICKNRTLPLAAIVYLQQAPETTVCSLGGARAFSRIWEGISVNVWDKKDLLLVSDTVQQVLQCVPVYHHACTADETAVAAIEQLLESRKQP